MASFVQTLVQATKSSPKGVAERYQDILMQTVATFQGNTEKLKQELEIFLNTSMPITRLL